MKKWIAILLAGVLAFGLAACGSEETKEESISTETETTEEADKTPTALRVNLASEPDYLDPALSSSTDGASLATSAFAGLYTYNEDGKLVADIAENMPMVSKDGCTYTVKLKKTKWSNGDKLTAKDFIYSWNRAIAPETAAAYDYLFDIIKRKKDGSLCMEAKDDYTLEITLNNPCPYFDGLMAFPAFFPVPQKSVDAANPDGITPGAWCQEAGFVCNGPFKLESWNHDEAMIYVKNENYWDAENVEVDELDFMLSADATAVFAAYNSGDLDFIAQIPTDETQNLMGDPEFYVTDKIGTYYIEFNVDAPLFDGMTAEEAASFREGVSALIDRQYIVDNVGQTGQLLADSFVPAGMADGNGGIFKDKKTSYFDAKKTGVKNAEVAIQCFEKAGYTFTDNGDGTYTPSPSISFDYIINDNTGHKAIAEAIQQDLAVLGIQMNIETEDWNVFLQDRKVGQYTLARAGWIADFDDPVSMLSIFLTESGNNEPQFGRSGKASTPDWTEFDALIGEINTTTDFVKRVDMLHRAEDVLMSTWAVIPIYYYNNVYMMKSNVTGVYSTVFGTMYFKDAVVK